jgi:hypothetical protein
VTLEYRIDVAKPPLPGQPALRQPVQGVGKYILLFFLFTTFTGLLDLTGQIGATIRPILLLPVVGFIIAGISGRPCKL